MERAQVGSFVKVIDSEVTRDCIDMGFTYEVGDVFEVCELWGGGITTTQGLQLYNEEFEVYRDSMSESTAFSRRIKALSDELTDLLVRKNKDYGDSFGKQYEEYGMTSALVRMDDKMNRLKSLKDKDETEVAESLQDTALDLAGYAIMLADQLRRRAK